MGLSFSQYMADGIIQVFALTFPYLKKEHVHVYVDGVEDVGFTWDSSTIVRPSVTPPAGKLVLLKRETPKNQLSTDYDSGSLLDEETLDNAQKELFYIIQEGVESVEGSMTVDPTTNIWDANGIRIAGVGAPVEPTDAASKEYVDTVTGINSAAEALVYRDQTKAFRDAAEDIVADLDTRIPEPTPADFEKALVVDVDGKYVLGEASGGGGLLWGVHSTDQVTETGAGYLMDNSAASHTVTLHANPESGDTVAIGDGIPLGSFARYPCTIARNGMTIQGLAEDMILDVNNQRATLVWSGSTWLIVDLVPASNAFEYMPYAVMHVQDQKPQGTDGGSSIVGTQTRTLNQVVGTNEITGASLSNNQITLPPGTYSIKLLCPVIGVATTKVRLYNVTSASYLFEGQAAYNSLAHLNCTFTLTVTSVLEVRQYTAVVAATNGLGNAANLSGSIEIYTDCIITKIGGNYAPKPVISSARLQPMAGLNVEGGVIGFDITVTGTNQITVTKGMCLDSNLAHPIAVTSNTVVNLDATPNKMFQLFAVHVIASDMDTVRAYDSEAAAAADATIDRFRWIDFWQNYGTIARSGYSKAGVHWWSKASECAVNSKVAPPANCSTAIDLSTFLPGADRVTEVLFGAQSATALVYIAIGYDGTNVHHSIAAYLNNVDDTGIFPWNYSAGSSGKFMPIIGTTVYWGDGAYSNTGTADLRLHAVKLRR